MLLGTQCMNTESITLYKNSNTFCRTVTKNKAIKRCYYPKYQLNAEGNNGGNESTKKKGFISV